MNDNPCEKVIDDHYQRIYNYCYSQLNYSHHAAADCTQEVFLIMLEKQKRLDMEGNIKIWLYRTANNVIRQYIRKRKRHEAVDIDECAIAVDNTFEIKGELSVLDRLSQEEYSLIEEYYSGKYPDRTALAEKHGVTIEKLYKMIHFIKKKLE